MGKGLSRFAAWPLLLLLHLAFTLFSLLLRVSQSLTHAQWQHRRSDPPYHVALCLPSRSSQRVRKRRRKVNEQERRALVESLKRVVRWAIEDGVRELSAYSDLGWDGVPSELGRYTVSTSTSRTSSSSPSTPALRADTPPDSLSTLSLPSAADEIETDATTLVESEASPHSSPTPTPKSGLRKRQTLKSPSSSTTALTLGDARHGTVKLYLLPALDLAPVATKYAQSGTPPSQITVQSVDADVRSMLGMDTDPDLLIIHPLSPLGPVRAFLPRPAPELSSYPFWYLRITEIYQTPQTLPLVGLLAPLVQRLRVSSLPALVKIGFAMPLVKRDRVRGALRREDWDGGLDALGKVEQRLGK